jgi:hypothetical protein
VTNMIKSEIMKDHGVPIVIFQFFWNMSRNIIVNFSEILGIFSAMLFTTMIARLTETKKLDVPSARSKKSGNSFSQVSSPYISIFPAPFAFICASQVSCVASVDVVSDSAKFRITSRKDGIDPVVIALILGIVIVGDVAWAVKGRAAPFEIRLTTY